MATCILFMRELIAMPSHLFLSCSVNMDLYVSFEAHGFARQPDTTSKADGFIGFGPHVLSEEMRNSCVKFL